MRVRRTFALAFSLVICSFFAFSPGHAQISIGVNVDVEPPPLPVYDQPPIPAPGYLWVPGYWAWDDNTGYYWVPGTWVTPPEPELLWTPGYWGWDDGAYQFHDGYWGPQIGFYGGVAYGFGYTGDGYEGGQWRNGIFFYNRSVNNISNVSITNVYNKTVVVNNTSNVSYNGGTGGTAAKPTPEQITAGKEHHVAATPEQTRHMEAAAKDPALSLNSNHGHPAVAATVHPAMFKGPGIIAARPGKPIAAVTPEGHRKAAPSNPAALPGNNVGPGNAVTGPGNKVVPGSAPAGPGNAAISPGNKPGREMREHKGGAATPGAGNTVSPEIKEHKGNANGGPPPGPGSTTQTKLPTNAVHAPAPQIARPSPPPPRAAAPPPPPRAAAPPPPPAPRVAAPAPPRPAPPPPRPAAPAAKPKCQPGQHC